MRTMVLPVLCLLGLSLSLTPGCARKPATDTAVGSEFDNVKQEKKTAKADKPELEKNPNSDAEADPKVDAKATAEAEAKAKAKAKAEADAEAKAEARAKAKSDAEAKARAKSKSKNDTEARTDPKAEAQPTPVSDGSGILLRLNHPLGRPMVYECTFNRKQTGPSKFSETNSFYLYQYCQKKMDNLDLLSMVRAYLARNRDDVYENKKKVFNKILPMAPESVDLGPNFQVIDNQRCYAFDGQNNIAYRTDQLVELTDGSTRRGSIVRSSDKTLDENTVVLETAAGQVMLPKAQVKQVLNLATPHLLTNDTVHYFFPIMSRKPVEAGSTWAFKVPVIVPIGENQSINMNTYFDVRVKCHLKELSGSGENQTALIEYQYSGLFDTQIPEYAARFGQAFLQSNHISSGVEGSGSMRMNVAKNIMMEKIEDAKISSSINTSVPQPENQPPKEFHEAIVLTNTFTMKWLPPGTVLKDKSKVPPME